MKGKTLALLALFLASILGSCVIVFIKVGLKTVPPFAFTALRFFIASITLLPFFLMEKQPNSKDAVKLTLISTLPSLNILLFIIGIRFTSANIGQVLYVAVPIIVALLSFLILKEKLTFRKIAGIALGFAGTVMLLTSKKIVGGYSFQENFLGSLLIVVGAILFSFYLIFSKQMQRKYSPLLMTGYFNIVCTILALALTLLTEIKLYPAMWGEFNFTSLGLLLYVAIFGTSVYYLLQQYVIKKGSAVLSSVILYIQPILTAFWAYAILGEKINGNFFISAVMIVLASIMVAL